VGFDSFIFVRPAGSPAAGSAVEEGKQRRYGGRASPPFSPHRLNVAE
jgi:hypothetical protein